MGNINIYEDIANRTGGDIYIGVVGPVRTGKSTFINKMMEKFVIPNISNKLQKQIATDEMPQSAEGKTIMTTEPKFVPANSVKVKFNNKSTANIRLIDCVGYLIDGVSGALENDKPRMVKTPWNEEHIPFENAAEIGTKKVIDEYSTVGVLITTDGSITDLPRENYIQAENKAINELKKQKKPFIIIVNCKDEQNSSSITLCESLQEKYNVPVLCKNVLNLTENDITEIMERLLMEFPMNKFNVDIPKWMRVLPADNSVIQELLSAIKEASSNINKMSDFSSVTGILNESENFEPLEISEIKLGEGCADYKVTAKEGVFYKTLSSQCGDTITDECELMSYIKEFSNCKKQFIKMKDALSDAEKDGYGVVLPSVEEMNLQEPVLVKQGGKYGVKLKASAPSLHIIKVDVETEVSPIVGTEKQGEDMVNYLMNQFEDNPNKIWQTDMFGKSLHCLVKEGLSGKITAVPVDAKNKMRKTLTKMVNENKGGMICILL